MNLPNKITIARVCLIPVYLFVYLAQPFSEVPNMWLALTIFSVASITDAVDGYVAKRYGLVSNFGKLMDPLADKLLVSAALIAFVASGTLSAWVVVLIISREFFVSGIRQLCVEQGIVIAASPSAKFKTITQMVLIIYILLPLAMFKFDWIVISLTVITVLASLYSGIEYAVKNRSVFGKAS
ncbi:MAG: CDP-diacylglycerol--glycerol-3-phosphate 3-phosphatidyltransferase [Defluviitaleaceae bacterium]|nr:CDP-diacylglycerol--glycerol-3-phosphate 3-phosphatidyltransferase [Defluviitaleaceae bacterium]